MRFWLGVLVGAVGMYWYINYGGEFKNRIEGWVEAASRDYSVNEATGNLAGKWR